MTRRLVAAFVAGAVFAVGLAISGMTDPAKVLGFLDVTGAWDPSLALVMAGAVGVHFFAARWAKSLKSPILGGNFDLPKDGAIDRRLVGGAALFGLGWGAAGYCPGPAVVASVGLAPTTCLFLLSMITAIWLVRLGARRGAGAPMKTRS
ncbi:MAG: YeeE/YedE family protein [Labilithrix sp.]|nr:YeeE/YedE family protein [Labilithrix sp.]MCW5812113.1 YeeE/YedE family protein [Labilithrix sp.]